MDYIERETDVLPRLEWTIAGEWYLMGFEDAYRGHVAVTPLGQAGEQYNRGYTEGLAAVQRDFFAAISNYPVSLETYLEL